MTAVEPAAVRRVLRGEPGRERQRALDQEDLAIEVRHLGSEMQDVIRYKLIFSLRISGFRASGG